MNPYEAPRATVSSDPKRIRPPTSIRWMAGFIAFAGVIYLPASIFIIFIPGSLIWLGWVTIAFGKPWLNKNWFWWFSLIWNLGWALVFLTGSNRPAILPVTQCLFATVISGAALVINQFHGSSPNTTNIVGVDETQS